MIELVFSSLFLSPFFFHYGRFPVDGTESIILENFIDKMMWQHTISWRNIIILFRFSNNTSNKLYIFGEYFERICCYEKKKKRILSMDLVSFSFVYWILAMFSIFSSQFVVCNFLFWSISWYRRSKYRIHNAHTNKSSPQNTHKRFGTKVTAILSEKSWVTHSIET